MVAIPLASKSDPAEREVVGIETLVNMRAVKAPSQSKSEQFYLTRTPGFGSWSACSPELCRGLYAATSTLALGLYGSTLFKFNSSGGPTSIGSISGTSDVRWAINNANEVVIVTGTTAYQYDIDANSLSVVSDNDLPANPIDVGSIDGIILYAFADRRVFYTPVNDANSIDSLDFFTVPGTGQLKAVVVLGQMIFFFSDKEYCVYVRDGNDADEPFKLLKGAGKPFGCINTHANSTIAGSLYFVDQDGIARSIAEGGGLPQAISNSGVQVDIRLLEDKDEIRVWGYTSGGTGFVVVRSSEFAWVYDIREVRWHNRLSYQRTTWQPKFQMRFANLDIIAPDQSGEAFYLSEDLLTENGEHIVWEVTCPTVHQFPNGIVLHRLALDIEAGTAVGADGAEEDQEPAITMFKSIDGGKTWSTGRQASLGRRGEWNKPVTWNRLGMTGRHGVIFRFSGSAAVANALMNLDLTPSKRAA